MSNLWFNYAWPSLKGNGPEALIQTIVYGAIAMVLIPPCRRWFTRHYDSIKEHVSAEHVKLHAKMDHIIKHHPDIPDFKEKL